jgi:hypothetical protein
MGNTTKFRFFSSNRGLVVGVAAGVLLSASFATWAAHDPIDPGTMTMFDDGLLIKAEPFNEMFTELYDWAAGVDAHIEVQDAKIAARVIDASPCGEIMALDGGLGGYANAAALRAALDSCSDVARMCTSEEMVRYSSSGGNLDGYVDGEKWVSSGVMSHSDTYGYVNDCSGWTSTQYRGASWHKQGSPDFTPCQNPSPILCCD